jgi:hypothetical protein
MKMKLWSWGWSVLWSSDVFFFFFPSATVFIPALFFFFVSDFLKWRRMMATLVLISMISSDYIISFCFSDLHSSQAPVCFSFSPSPLPLLFSCFYRPEALCW